MKGNTGLRVRTATVFFRVSIFRPFSAMEVDVEPAY